MKDCQFKGRLVIDKKKPRGEQHGQSKLNESQVRQIRDLRSSGHPGISLALRFGISPQTVSRIVNNKIWTHLQGDINDDCNAITAGQLAAAK
jgi:DNA invertase Pin-like site-specific DNA recombinase